MMPRQTVIGIALLSLACAPATSRQLHYGMVGDAGLLACDQQAWRGEGGDAGDCYRRLLRSTADLALRAEAAWALGELKAANRWFRDAVAARPEDPQPRARWGWLFAQTHQAEDAQALFSEALELAPEYGFARVGLAHVLAEGFSTKARAHAAAVSENLQAPAGARIHALLLQARLALEEDRRQAASSHLDQAGVLLESSVWPRLELWSLRAAVAAVADQPIDDWTGKALAFNPEYGDIFATPAYFMIVNRHYRKAIDWLGRAVQLQPDNWPARRELAVNLLRINRIDEARAALELAYRGDPFDPRTVNTLRLLDTFDRFVTKPWPDGDSPRLLMRLHQEEAEALAPHVARLSDEAIALFSERYGFELRQPMVVEIYPDHEDFAVRTVGLPGIGILGATFGYLLAMDSPSARSPDQFHWASTLWHEVAHVFTLEASDHRVSRWFSEGVSVFEEWRSGPLPGRQIPISVLTAMAEDKFLPLADLDQGFVRPSYPEQVIVSYMQAGLVCQYINDAYGKSALRRILEQYRQGADTPAALEASLGQPMARIQADFDAWVDDEFGLFLATLGTWQGAHEKAARAAAEGRWRAAEVNARLALSLFPEHVEPDSDYLVLARARAEAGDTAGEREALLSYQRHGGHTPEALLRLSQLLEAAGRREQAMDVLEALHHVAPLAHHSHARLGQWLLEADRAADALREFEIALALKPLDRAAALLNVARAHHALGESEQARHQVLSALEIAPHYREAQKLLLALTASGS